MTGLPFAEEVQHSSQTYYQQTHTENDEDYLLFAHWLKNELWGATPGASEALLTTATQTEESYIIMHCDEAADTDSQPATGTQHRT